MKKIKKISSILLTFSIILIFTSCTQKNDAPQVVKNIVFNVDSKSRIIKMDNFPSISYGYTWGDGRGFSPYNAPEIFKELDKKLYELLIKERGIFKLKYRINEYNTDKYGNKIKNESWIDLGRIDADELRKYKSFNYWSNRFHSRQGKRTPESNIEYLYFVRDGIIE